MYRYVHTQQLSHEAVESVETSPRAPSTLRNRTKSETFPSVSNRLENVTADISIENDTISRIREADKDAAQTQRKDISLIKQTLDQSLKEKETGKRRVLPLSIKRGRDELLPGIRKKSSKPKSSQRVETFRRRGELN